MFYPPTLSEAVRKSYNSGGYPVGEWVELSENGLVKGYNVPSFLLEKRDNPDGQESQKPEKPNEGKQQENKPQEVIQNHSLLPPGEDYVRPVGMIGLNTVVGKAIEHNTLQSRAVIATGITGIGAIIGHAVSDSSSGCCRLP
jgi:hypothetical protein